MFKGKFVENILEDGCCRRINDFVGLRRFSNIKKNIS